MYFSLEKESHYAISRFISPPHHHPRCAYISKNYQDQIDLDFLSNIRGGTFIVGAPYEKLPKNCRCHSLLSTYNHSKKILIHFYTFIEQDHISKWKIYDIRYDWV